jgi:hypothetical protein
VGSAVIAGDGDERRSPVIAGNERPIMNPMFDLLLCFCVVCFERSTGITQQPSLASRSKTYGRVAVKMEKQS